MANIETSSGENISSNELHEVFHTPLKDSNLPKVQELIETGVKPCQKNCYVLAQQNLNPDFLKILVEHDSSGVNTTDEDGDTLLMRDILLFKCRHFELLIGHGADVNHCNGDGFTALHYATIIKETPIEVIKKLIELKADVNKAVEEKKKKNDGDETFKKKSWLTKGNKFLGSFCDGDTPLINVLARYDYLNGFEKVKLLVESGAEVNLANGSLQTPLLFAAGINTFLSDAKDKNIKLLKYLMDNGAKASFVDCHDVNAIILLIDILKNGLLSTGFPADETLIEEYFIPAFELLMEAGYDLFLRARNNELKHIPNSPLFILLYITYRLCDIFTNGHKLILHVVNLAFKKLNDSSFKFENELQQHPFECIWENLFCFSYNKNLHPSILNMIFSDQVDELKNYSVANYGRSVAETIVEALPITEIKYWLVKLHELNIDVNRNDPLISILLKRFIREIYDANDKEQLKEIIDYLLEQKYEVCEPIHWFEKHELLPRDMTELIKTFNVPYCVFKSAEYCNIELLKKFLPYWNQPPLAVLLCDSIFRFQYSDSGENITDKYIERLVLFLCEYGGPLSHGTILYNEMKRRFIYNNNPLLKEFHESPASLKVLCRTVIRANAVGHGNNLPHYLASLVPSGLKKFLTCDFS